MKKQPFQRNWLKEAYLIVANKFSGSVKKEHVIALGHQHFALVKKHEELVKKCELLFSEASKQAAAKGLLVPTKEMISGRRLEAIRGDVPVGIAGAEKGLPQPDPVHEQPPVPAEGSP